MKIKTSELTGAALDWAVAKCEPDMKECVVHGRGAVRDMGYHRSRKGYTDFFVLLSVWRRWFARCEDHPWGSGVRVWSPSTDWAQGGPIIEQEGVTLTHQANCWAAQTDDDLFAYGPTPLIAAMRCYCCAKLGDEVDIPEELCQQQSS